MVTSTDSAQLKMPLSEGGTRDIPATIEAYEGGQAEQADPLENNFGRATWSYSRRSTFEQCLRRYYNDYYGSSDATYGVRDASSREIQFLKGVQTRHERIGKILHTAIKGYLQAAQQGDIWSVEKLLDLARWMFRADVNYSRAYPDGEMAALSEHQPALLYEYHYRWQDADALCAEAEARLLDALQAFATEDVYEEFRARGRCKETLIERWFSLEGFPCKVIGIVDFAFVEAGGEGGEGNESRETRVTIVDWKIGADEHEGADSLQLATYGLWAINQFKVSPAAVRICKAYLGSCSIRDYRVDDKLLARARARIIQDTHRMAALHEYGRERAAEVFTPCMRPAVCQLCPYMRKCYA